MSWLAGLGGKYAAFVVSAYAATAVVLLVMTLETLWRARRWRRRDETLKGVRRGRAQRG